MYIYTEGDTPALEQEAQWIAFEVLAPAYPGHNFSVRAYPGGFFIRDLRFPHTWGMNCPKANELYSASSYKKKVVMMYGEWLERANQKRGLMEEGQEIQHVEGVPDKYQRTTEINNVVVGVDGLPLRTEARPQVNG